MDKLKIYFNKYLWLIILGGLFALGGLTFWLYGLYEEKAFDETVQQSQSESQTAVNEAQTASETAANISVERRVEDSVRERVIVPKLDAARRRSQNSKIELEKAKQKYSDEQITHKNVSSSRTDNCAKLHELYPNTRFEYCAESDADADSKGSN